MKSPGNLITSRIIGISLVILLSCFWANGQNFQIVWGMNSTLSGVSSSTNFTPHDASLTGAHPHGLPTILYYNIGTNDYAYGTTYWHDTGVEKYLSFSFSANTFEYDLSSVSFRVRRSPDGPKRLTLRSSLDGYSSDVSTFNISSDGVFYDVNIPFGISNLASGVGFRIYGFEANTYLGVIYFDQLIVNGNVNAKILAATLSSFEAKAEEEQVLLSWMTSMEWGTKGFVVEESQDAKNFTSIGTVEAKGSGAMYQFIDKISAPGIHYYRLKIVDETGEIQYSRIVKVYLRDLSNELMVAPNPASPDVIQIVNTFSIQPQIRLNDILGREIRHTLELNVYTNHLLVIPNYPLATGVYILTLTQEGRKQQVRVLVP